MLPEWRRLAVARGNAFLTPEWFLASIRADGDGFRPLVAVVRDDADLVRGVLPFVIAGRDRRRLRFGGSIRCDLLSPVAAPDDEEATAAAAVAALTQELRSRPVLELGNVDAAAAWWRAKSTRDRRLAAVRGPESPLPYIDLAGLDWDGYLATRSRGLRSQIGRKMRALRRDHDVRLRFTATPEELKDDLPTLFRLHDARWCERPGASSLSDPRLRAFHADFSSGALAHGWLRLLTLEVNGSPAASWYGWHLGDRWSYYQAGFDPAWSRQSVGLLILAESIRAAIESGATEYDMLLGDEAFKSRFADASRTARTVTLVSRFDPARVAAVARTGLRYAWRRLSPSFRARVTERIAAVRERSQGDA